ncbi:MAG TPA: hypothetical protein VJR29_09715 [bacterium]|nr:hypothetical protein [bacterium]
MFRLFLLALVIYFLLRLVRRVVASLASGASSPRPRPKPSTGPAGSGVIDEMKRCPTCGTYNPTRLAYRKKDLYFCNDRCHEDFNDGKKAS